MGTAVPCPGWTRTWPLATAPNSRLGSPSLCFLLQLPSPSRLSTNPSKLKHIQSPLPKQPPRLPVMPSSLWTECVLHCASKGLQALPTAEELPLWLSAWPESLCMTMQPPVQAPPCMMRPWAPLGGILRV